MKEKLRVMMFLNTTVFGGVEKHVADIVNGINNKQFEMSIVCPKNIYDHFKRELNDQHCTIIPISHGNFLHITSVLQFVRAVRKVKPHIIHCHLYNATRFGAPIAKILKVPAVIETGHLVERWRKGFKKFLTSSLDRILSIFVDHVIAVSQPVAIYFLDVKNYTPAKVTVIHNGCDQLLFNPERFTSTTRHKIKKAENIDKKSLVIGLIGRLEDQKGHTFFIKALPKIVTEHPNVQVLFVGDGNLKDSLLEQTKRNGTEGYISFLGFRKDLPELLSIIDVLVLPSLFEGMPLTLIEAAAMGVPVVATSVDGSKDVVLDGETGYLLSHPNKTEIIVEYVNKLLNHQQLRLSMGVASIKRAKNHFDIRDQIRHTEQVYLSALNKNNLTRK